MRYKSEDSNLEVLSCFLASERVYLRSQYFLVATLGAEDHVVQGQCVLLLEMEHTAILGA